MFGVQVNRLSLVVRLSKGGKGGREDAVEAQARQGKARRRSSLHQPGRNTDERLLFLSIYLGP